MLWILMVSRRQTCRDVYLNLCVTCHKIFVLAGCAGQRLPLHHARERAVAEACCSGTGVVVTRIC